MVGIDLGAIRWPLKPKRLAAIPSEKSTHFTQELPLDPEVRNEWVTGLSLAPCMPELRSRGLQQLTLEPSTTLAQQRAHGGQFTPLPN